MHQFTAAFPKAPHPHECPAHRSLGENRYACAIHFTGSTVAEVVTAVEGASAYRVELADGQVVVTRMEPRVLEGAIPKSAH